MFNVSILDRYKIVFNGRAESVVLPGATGEFEILMLHRPIISLLKEGSIIIDQVNFPIKKGVAKFWKDTLLAIVEV